MLIQNIAGVALFYHVAPRATQPALMMKKEQLPPYFECTMSILLSGNSELVTQSPKPIRRKFSTGDIYIYIYTHNYSDFALFAFSTDYFFS